MKKLFKIIIIFITFCFIEISSVQAVNDVSVNRNTDNSTYATYYFKSSSSSDDSDGCVLKFEKSGEKFVLKAINGSSLKLDSNNNRYICDDVSGGRVYIKFSESYSSDGYKTLPSSADCDSNTCTINGLYPYVEGDNTIQCGEHKLEDPTSDGRYCLIRFVTDPEGNVQMQYKIGDAGGVSKNYTSPDSWKNPSAGTYSCPNTGSSFVLNYSYGKGSIKSKANCPDILSADKKESDAPNVDTGMPDDTDFYDNDFDKYASCSSFFNSTFKDLLVEVYDIIRYLALILTVVFTIIDLIKAITSADNDALKKSSMKALKRFVCVIILFILPLVIRLILTIPGVLDVENPSDCLDWLTLF